MRIYKNRFYLTRRHPGISGFQEWDKWEYRIVTGYRAKSGSDEVVRPFLFNGRGIVRLEDGHLPEFQPVVKEKEIYDFLDQSSFAAAYLLNPHVYDLPTTH